MSVIKLNDTYILYDAYVTEGDSNTITITYKNNEMNNAIDDAHDFFTTHGSEYLAVCESSANKPSMEYHGYISIKDVDVLDNVTKVVLQKPDIESLVNYLCESVSKLRHTVESKEVHSKLLLHNADEVVNLVLMNNIMN